MHVYTPPGYETSSKKYPVFYLLHGAGDSDDSWSTVGRAGFILDNLIAAKSAKPMIVVMPAGHTRAPGNPMTSAPGDPFVNDFVTDVMPYVEKNYRVSTDRANTAIAGLSMGGGQTLNIAMAHPDRFALHRRVQLGSARRVSDRRARRRRSAGRQRARRNGSSATRRR